MEMLYAVPGWRAPFVMVNVSRGVATPITLESDHTDILAARDSGFLQIHCASCQEVLDSVLIAYRVAEDARVRLPAIVNQGYCTDVTVLIDTSGSRSDDETKEALSEVYGVCDVLGITVRAIICDAAVHEDVEIESVEAQLKQVRAALAAVDTRLREEGIRHQEIDAGGNQGNV